MSYHYSSNTMGETDHEPTVFQNLSIPHKKNVLSLSVDPSGRFTSCLGYEKKLNYYLNTFSSFLDIIPFQSLILNIPGKFIHHVGYLQNLNCLLFNGIP